MDDELLSSLLLLGRRVVVRYGVAGVVLERHVCVCEREVGHNRRTGDAGRGTGRRVCVDRGRRRARAHAKDGFDAGDVDRERKRICEPFFF